MQKAFTLISVALIVVLFASCNPKKEKKETNLTSFSFSNLFNECTPNQSYTLKTVIDSINNLKIDLPEHWEIQVTNNHEVRGIFAMDTSLYLKKELIHTILINSVEVQ